MTFFINNEFLGVTIKGSLLTFNLIKSSSSVSETSDKVRLDDGARAQPERHGPGLRAVQHHEAKDRVVGAGGGPEVRETAGLCAQ